MRTRYTIGSILAACCLGLSVLVGAAQDATATTDPNMPTTDPAMMPTTDPMMTPNGGIGPEGGMGESAMATIMDANGTQVGWALFSPSVGMMPPVMPMGDPALMTPMPTPDMSMPPNKVMVTVQVMGLTPGFHGLHLHTMGMCTDTGEGPFTGAGGHIPTEPQHPNHIGDFPAILVNADGTGYLTFETDRFTVASLMDADGTAIMIHAGPDNYANIPERYGTPDEETLKTGDSGDRVACGVLGAAMGPMGGGASTGGGVVSTADPALMPTIDMSQPTTDPAMMPTTDPNMPATDPAAMMTPTAAS
jgi:Cu-Zn family superoxide dismutase